MAKIAQYEPNQVQTEVTRQPTAQNAPAAAFGGDVAEGALDLIQAGIDLKGRVDTTSAEEALVQFERDKNDIFFNPDSGYFNTAGRNAYDNSSAATKALDDLKMKYGETLNQQSKQMFDQSADVHITRGQQDINRHSAKGLKTWEIGTLEAQVENTVENASLYWNDPERLKVQNIVGRQAIIDASEMLGDGPEAKNEKLQTYDSSFAKASVEAAIQSSSVDGKDALDKYGDKLEGPDKVKIEGAIERKAKVEKTAADAKAAVLTATNLVDQYESRSDIIEEVNKIEDPELRKKTMTESMARFSSNKTAKAETQDTAYNEGIDHFNGGGTAESFKTFNAEAWEGMSDKQRNNLLNGKHMTTDQVQFNNLLSLPRTDLAKINPAEYSHAFKPADVGKLRSAVDKAKKGQSYTALKTPSNKADAVAVKFFGKKSSWRGEKAKLVERALGDMQSELENAESEKGGKLSPSEIDDVLNNYSREFVVQRSNFGFDILAFDQTFNLKNTPPAKLSELSQYVEDNGDDSFTAVTGLLKEEGLPLTIDNVLNAYSQATK